ncbi:MAG: response regulator [Xanthobacteraceae bacterium]
MIARVLVVDDDPVQRRLIEAMLRRLGHEPLAADGGEAALRRLSDGHAVPVDCVVLDLTMPGVDAMSVLGRLRALGIDTPVIVQAVHGSVDAAVAAVRAGACDFVVQPVAIERLQVSLANALAQAALKSEVQRMRRSTGALAPAVIDAAPTTVPADSALLALLDAEGRMRPLDELEAEIIRFAIAHHDGRMSEVARRLKIGRSTLYRKLGELGLGETTQEGLVPDRKRSVAPE